MKPSLGGRWHEVSDEGKKQKLRNPHQSPPRSAMTASPEWEAYNKDKSLPLKEKPIVNFDA